MIELGVSNSESDTRPESLSKIQNSIRLKWSLLRKSYELSSRGRYVPIKIRERRWIFDVIQQADWLLVTNIGGTAKLWFQTNHGLRTTLTDASSLASVTKEWTGEPGCHTPSEGRINRVVRHWPPVGHMTSTPSYGLDRLVKKWR